MQSKNWDWLLKQDALIAKEKEEEQQKNPTYRVSNKTISSFSTEDLEKVKKIVSFELAKRNLKEV